jgi:hypothetical protein
LGMGIVVWKKIEDGDIGGMFDIKNESKNNAKFHPRQTRMESSIYLTSLPLKIGGKNFNNYFLTVEVKYGYVCHA